MAHSYDDLQRLPMNGESGLRAIARERFRALGMDTAWITKAPNPPTKDDLIDAIMQGAIPSDWAPDADSSTPEPAPRVSRHNTPNTDLAQIIAEAVESHLHIEAPAPSIDADAVKTIVRGEIEIALRDTVKRVEVKAPDGTIQNVGAQHKRFPELLAMIGAGVPV